MDGWSISSSSLKSTKKERKESMNGKKDGRVGGSGNSADRNGALLRRRPAEVSLGCAQRRGYYIQRYSYNHIYSAEWRAITLTTLTTLTTLMHSVILRGRCGMLRTACASVRWWQTDQLPHAGAPRGESTGCSTHL